MNFLEILVLSTGLAMDAFAVSIACGFSVKHPKVSHALKIASFFGVFQALMPLIGWALASHLRIWVEDIDHWIAFGLLSFVGIKMIFESFNSKNEPSEINSLETSALLVLAFATSIDALAAGISFSFLKIEILLPVITIGVVTFIFSFAGVKIGSKFGHYLEHKVTLLGGLVLMGFGLKILLEHLLTSSY